MNVNGKNIVIELRTVIDNNGDKELNIIKQKGKYFKKGELEVVIYREETEEQTIINNLLSIQPKKVNIKRSGAVSMNQQFLDGKITECLFQHPYGNIHMEINTLSIDYQPLDSLHGGQLIIDYKVKLNGQEERKQHLTLTYFEEDLY